MSQCLPCLAERNPFRVKPASQRPTNVQSDLYADIHLVVSPDGSATWLPPEPETAVAVAPTLPETQPADSAPLTYHIHHYHHYPERHRGWQSWMMGSSMVLLLLLTYGFAQTRSPHRLNTGPRGAASHFPAGNF